MYRCGMIRRGEVICWGGNVWMCPEMLDLSMETLVKHLSFFLKIKLLILSVTSWEFFHLQKQ